MKVAFIYQHANQSMPLGIGYLSSMLKSKGYDTQFFILNKNKHQECLKKVLKYKPDIAAYSIITGEQDEYLIFNSNLKKWLDVISVFGGPHPTFFPEIVYELGVDAVCIGEGESAFAQFVEKVDSEGKIPEKSDNFWIKDNSEILKSCSMPLITDLDSLPFPDRDAYYKVYPFVKHFGIKNFNAQRGCPYTCSYCFNEAYNAIYEKKKILRQRSPENICEEILQVKKKYPLKTVYFVDDSFTFFKKWIFKFCEEYAKKVRIPFGCNLRFDNTTEEVIIALKDAGCTYVHVGLESGNEYVRKDLLKRRMSTELMIERANLFTKYGIKMLTENIVGAPGETYEMYLETLKMNQKIKPVYADLSIFTPYPKLPLTDYAIKEGYFDGDYSKIESNYFGKSLIKQKEGEENKIVNFRAFFSFLSRYPKFEKLLLSEYFLNQKESKLIELFGNISDGYHMFKMIPYRFTPVEFARAAFHFISNSR